MDYGRHYSDESFWSWMRRNARKAGRRLLRIAFELYFAMISPHTPMWAKGMCAGALGYLIFPFDLLMDPVYHDDVSVISSALVSVGRYVTDDIKKRAEDRVTELLGPDNDGGDASLAANP